MAVASPARTPRPRRVLLALAAASLAACAEPSARCPRLDGPPPAVEPDEPGRVIPEPDDDAAVVFDPDVLHAVELDLAPEDLAAIDADPAAEAYVPATITLDGERVGPVGLRYKGYTGSWYGCLSEQTKGNPWLRQGSKACPKLSMKVDVHHVDDGLRLHGLKKLELHAMNTDASMMREQLGFALFRASGVVTSRTAFARVVVNGVPQGLFLLVEAIDGPFTAAHFADGDGNVYAEVWPTAAEGHGDAPSEDDLRDALETHEDDADVGRVAALARAIQDADGLERLDAIAEAFSVDHLARFLAVDRAIADDDGATHLYCRGKVCRAHNFFLYEEEHEPRLWVIPSDLDMAFLEEGDAAPPVAQPTELIDPWDAHHLPCRPRGGDGPALPQLPPACDPLINAMTCGFRDPVDEARRAFVEGPMRAEAVDARREAWTARVADTVAEAHRLDERQPSPEAWAAGVEALRARIDVLRRQAGRR